MAKIPKPLPTLAFQVIHENISTRSKKLDLSNCGLDEIPEDVTGFHWLEELTLSTASYYDDDLKKYVSSENKGPENTFQRLPEGMERLSELRHLTITGSKANPIVIDLTAIGQLRKLRHLHLNNTVLSDLSPLSNLKDLEILAMYESQVKDISALSCLYKLRILRIRINKVSDISPLEKLTSLEVLRFGKNQVTDLRPLSGLIGLKTLSFYSNLVEDLSPVEYLFNLESLTLRGNKVSDISPLSVLRGLVSLDMSSNKIVDLTPITYMSSLTKLSFRRNRIQNVSVLYGKSTLRELNFNENRVRNISVLATLPGLEELDISNNEITDVSPLYGLINLEKLSLRKNEVEDISGLSNLVKLKELDFGNTKVTGIPFFIFGVNLTRISFENSQVLSLRPLIEIPSLQKFVATRCPIIDCPADVYESGDPRQLKAYFQAMDHPDPLPDTTMLTSPAKKIGRTVRGIMPPNLEPAAPKRDVKLIILGNANTGKTNLVNWLEKNSFIGDRKTTHGLEVHRWEPSPTRFPALKNISVSIWDFGGQEYYHEAYRLFLSSNALYLLLWCKEYDINGRRSTILTDGELPVELEHFELRYWLDTIQCYSGGKKDLSLLTVQNKTDNSTDKKRIPQEWHDKYSITESFHISLMQGWDKSNSRQHNILDNFVKELGFLIEKTADQAETPPYWQHIRDKILLPGKDKQDPFARRMKSQLFISLSSFWDACAEVIGRPISEDDQHTLPRWLDRGGVVVFFPDIPSLSDKIFLYPDRLAKEIYEVLNKKVLEKGGEFSAGDIPGKKEEFRTIFLEIAVHLGLIFPHPDREKGPDYYIAPQYLPDKHPVEDLFNIASRGFWESGFCVRVPLFYYKKVLHGLLIHFAADKNTECRYFWKHGILFTKNKQGVLIKGLYPLEDQHEGTLLIGVEKSRSGETGLQKEIFNQLLAILGIGQKEPDDQRPISSTGEPDSPPEEAFSAEDMEKLEKIEVLVSANGRDFVDYLELLRNSGEPKVLASDQRTWLMTRNFEEILPVPPPHAKKVFLSYSHHDISWLGKLRTQLSGLRRANEIESWDDREILPGDQWNETIRTNLENADVYILLLSANFIASDYIWNIELSTALGEFAKRRATLIPVLIDPIDLESIPFITVGEQGSYRISDFEIVPKENGRLKAVSLWSNHQEALTSVAESIRRVVRGL